MTFLRGETGREQNETEAGMHEGENMAVLGIFRDAKRRWNLASWIHQMMKRLLVEIIVFINISFLDTK